MAALVEADPVRSRTLGIDGAGRLGLVHLRADAGPTLGAVRVGGAGEDRARARAPVVAVLGEGEAVQLLTEVLDHVIALGGGVIGDLVGFACSIVKRGCSFIQVPTTLLAQVDSSVGGKTAINVAAGKNMIGAFHQPALVVIDPTTLGTLPRRDLAAGYAEVVKYGLIDDADFFTWCEVNGEALLDGAPSARTHAIEKSVRAKAAIVAEDEEEKTGRRALLNLSLIHI